MKNLNQAIFFILCFFTQNLLAQQSTAQDIKYKALKSNMKTTITSSGRKTVFFENEMTVTSEIGRMELSLNRISFFGQPSQFRLVKAYSVTDQQVYPVKSQEVSFSRVQNEKYGLTDLMQAQIPMSHLKVGSLVYYSYEILGDNTQAGFAEEVVAMTNQTLAQEEIYQFYSKKPLKSAFFNTDGLFSYTEGKKNNFYFVEIRPTVMAYQTVGKQIGVATLLLSTAPSWEAINKKLAPQYEKIASSALPLEFKNISKQALSLTSSQAKIELISREISKLMTYSGDWRTDQKKYFPQTFSHLLMTRKGDCKDYASVMTAILRDVGFTAYPALIMKSPSYIGESKLQMMAKVPAQSMFNHALVWARDSTGREWWVDPTNPFVFAETLSNDILGNYALVLDNRSKNIQFLPDKNSTAADSTIDQTLTISADHMVQSSGKMGFTESSYLSLAQIEKLTGSAGVNKVLAYSINPQAKIEVYSKKSGDERVPDYNFSYMSKNIVVEKEKGLRQVVQPHPAQLILMMQRRHQDSYIGEIGEFKLLTTVKNVNTPDELKSDCYVQSPWVSVERYVENKGKDLLITDIIRTKKRLITQADMKNEEYERAMSDISSCVEQSAVNIDPDTKAKNAENAEIEKKLGPSVYLMTPADIDLLEKLSGPSLEGRAARKIFKYTYLKLKENPKDVALLIASADALVKFGFVRGHVYDSAYLEEGLFRLKQAEDLLGPDKNKNFKLIKSKMYIHLYQEKFQLAADELKLLLQIEPNSFNARLAAANLASFQSAHQLSEQWLQAAGQIAATDFDKYRFHRNLAFVLSDQKKYKEALSHYEFIIQADPKNAWHYHNAATVYQRLGEIDKAIEMEFKALDISSFGMAKYNLGNLYYCKSGLATESYCQQYRQVSLAEREKNLLEAIKWRPNHVVALQNLAMQYMMQYQMKPNERTLIEKAKTYIDQATAAEPQNIGLALMSQDITNIYQGGVNASSFRGKLVKRVILDPSKDQSTRIPASTKD